MPLTSIAETDAKGDNITHKQAANEQVGNANAWINYLRSTKITRDE